MKKIYNIFIYTFALIGLFLTFGFFAVKFGITNTTGIIDTQTETFNQGSSAQNNVTKEYIWNTGDEWDTFKNAITKDIATLKRVEGETGVKSRLIVMAIAIEQLRLFHSERQVFKEVFAPLKLLGNQTQFSWGIAGIKEETAKKVEEHLKDTSSPYYLGKQYETYLNFETSNIDQERFERITNPKDRYYAYLYAALYIKQFIVGWQKADVDISNRPDIIATLYNIGFQNSKPNPNPQTGGAEIDIKEYKISFGRLGGEFYHSNELLEYFPK